MVPDDGEYSIRVEADDQASVVLNHRDTLFYNHGWADNADASKRVVLRKGDELEVEVFYQEKDLEASISLMWKRNDEDYMPMPAIDVWKGFAEWQHVTRCFTTKGDHIYFIEFTRPRQSLVIPGMPLLKKGTKITLLGTTASLKWKQQRNGSLSIDLSSLDPEEFNTLDHAWVFRVDKQ